jgi:hypothetical protein
MECARDKETECKYHRTLVDMVLLLSGPAHENQILHTGALVDELAKREGVKEIIVPVEAKFQYLVWEDGRPIGGGCNRLTILNKANEQHGPARILVVID